MAAHVGDYMTENPHSIAPFETLKVAHELMQKHKIRHLPVLSKRRVVGLVSERDLSLVHLYPDMDLEHSKVEDLMLQDIYTVHPNEELKEVVHEMGQRKLGSAVVVDAGGQLKGIFTAVDALKLLHKIYTF